ncbi:cytochrome c biogenesis protein ResB [Trichloromonas sp.]|uniref:cytochrome c biogenesis protein ResB n=1 Tax=Trichloromonas sp. TaxID=3069249 RepID=UPI003D81BF06
MRAKKNPIDALWDFFCSLKLTIVTLILLAVTSIIGTVIQQNRSPEEYLQEYSESTYRLLDSLQFFDMYHSWWFLALLGVFSLNLIACSINRFPRVWKAATQPVLVADDSLFQTFSNVDEHLVAGSVDEVKARLETFLKQQFASPVVTEKEGVVHLFSQKMPYARFGVYITHLSILIIFIGAIIGSLWGYKAYVNIVEGSAESRVWPRGSNTPIDLGFSVRCDEFSVSYYEGSNRPKEFKSLLTVIDGGQIITERRPVIVNDPLSYKGITFYQSSYGTTGDAVLKLKATVKATGETVDLTVRQGQRVSLPGGASMRVVDFAPSYQNFGPGARLEVVDAGGKRSSFLVLKAFPGFDAQRSADFAFSLQDFQQRYYTGLQVAKDPGVWVVWVGCTLMIIGSMVAFFLSHRRIWVTIQPVGKKTGVKIGGTAHRNQPGFELFFDELKKNLKSELAS